MEHAFGRNMTVDDLAERFIASPPVCPKLFGPLAAKLFDQPSIHRPPPSSIPDEMMADFLLNGLMRVDYKYFSNVYAGVSHGYWSRRLIDEWTDRARNYTLSGNYGRKHAHVLYAAILEADVRNKTVLVIGSENPWVEALLLAAGALHVTTLEYGKITSGHPQVTAWVPEDLSQLVSKGLAERDKFDAVVSYSSIEHSGLGRYGDQLNPWGDVITVARAWCLMKKKSFIILGLPGCAWGLDLVNFNGHRNYGRARLAVLLANFRVSKLRFHADDNGLDCMARDNHRGNHQFVLTAERVLPSAE